MGSLASTHTPKIYPSFQSDETQRKDAISFTEINPHRKHSPHILLIYGYYRAILISNTPGIPQDIATICCNYIRKDHHNHLLHMKCIGVYGRWCFSAIDINDDDINLLYSETYIGYEEDGDSEQTYNGCCIIPKINFNNDPYEINGHAYAIISLHNFVYNNCKSSHCLKLLYQRFDENNCIEQKVLSKKQLCDVVYRNCHSYVYCGQRNGVIYANNKRRQMYQLKLDEIGSHFEEYVMEYRNAAKTNAYPRRMQQDLEFSELTLYPDTVEKMQSNLSLCYMSDKDILFAMECAGNRKMSNINMKPCFFYEFESNKWNTIASYNYNCTSNKPFECGLYFDEYNSSIYAVSNLLTASKYDPLQHKWQHILEPIENNEDYINIVRKPTVWLNDKNRNILYYAVAAMFKDDDKYIPFDIKYIDMRKKNKKWNQCNVETVEAIKTKLQTGYRNHAKPALSFFR